MWRSAINIKLFTRGLLPPLTWRTHGFPGLRVPYTYRALAYAASSQRKNNTVCHIDKANRGTNGTFKQAEPGTAREGTCLVISLDEEAAGSSGPSIKLPLLPTSTTDPLVHCFWDLDNKQPQGTAATNKIVASIWSTLSSYGEVMSVRAFGNQNSFNYLPKTELLHRQTMREKRRQGPEEGVVHRCGICGQKFQTFAKMEKHFKTLHEREMLKRKMNKRHHKSFFKDKAKVDRYYDMEETVRPPAQGYNLQRRLRKQEVQVTRTANTPQAADIALDSQVSSLLKKRQDKEVVVCIISDDRGFKSTFRRCQDSGCLTVAVCRGTDVFGQFADVHLDWDVLKEGLYIPPDTLEELEEYLVADY